MATAAVAPQDDDGRPLALENISYKKLDREGAETLVLIHGMDSDLFTFDSVTTQLHSHFQLILVDSRGHGRTKYEGFKISPMAMKEDLLVLLDFLGVKRAHGLGHSFGAFTAYLFAKDYPSRVLSLIIEDMGLVRRGVGSMVAEKELMEHAKSIKEKMPPNAEYQSKEEMRLALLAAGVMERRVGTLLTTQCYENENGTFSVYFRTYSSTLYSHFVRQCAQYSPEIIATIQDEHIRVLFLLADEASSSVSRFEEAELRKMFGSVAEVARIVGSAHSVHKSHPDEFVERIAAFVEKLSTIVVPVL